MKKYDTYKVMGCFKTNDIPHYVVKCGGNISTMTVIDFCQLIKNESKNKID